jgi:hypothetical protein
MREHWLCTVREEADADGNLPCRCGDWREPGAEVDDENDWDSHLADVALAVLALPVDRGAVLREAATRYEEILANALHPEQDPRYWTAVRDITLGLRHLAAEAPQPETQARPTRTEWQIELHWRGEWRPDGPAWEQREDAVTRYESAITRPGGRPQRLVRQETSYTVEAEHLDADAESVSDADARSAR